MLPEIWFPNIGIKIQKLNPVAFSVFNIDIYWYGILIAFGIFLGILVTLKEIKRTNQNVDLYYDFSIYAVIFGIISARLYYVNFSWNDFKDNLLQIFAIRNGGIAIYGAIIGVLICAFVFTKVKKVNFFQFVDTLVPLTLIGQIVGRWGNFVNREAYGGYTNSLFAMRYLKSQATVLNSDLLDNIVNVNGVEYIQVHPTFLYESVWNLFILIILLLHKKNKKFEGELTILYFIGYGIGRFLIEGLRTDALKVGNTDIFVSQALSLCLVIIFTLFYIIKRVKLSKSSTK